ncbi:MAG: GNAT family N-acetyltransferase [Actinomycetota bacterium]
MFSLRAPVINRLLEHCGLLCRWRAGMTLDLSRLREPPLLPPGYEIVGWDPSRLKEVAWVDHIAYQGTLDAQLYGQYFSTPAGCELMWREALDGKFGTFDTERSLLLLRDGRVCGDIMASIRNPQEGFIGNLAVIPEHRGGTGRSLLLTCLWAFRDAGFQRVSLAVTLDNVHAFRLYSRLGFVTNNRFPLMTRTVIRS